MNAVQLYRGTPHCEAIKGLGGMALAALNSAWSSLLCAAEIVPPPLA
jgi:hypothetical protein